MYLPFLRIHSGLRWLVLLSFVIALIFLFQAAFYHKNAKSARLFAQITLVFSHLQLVLGLVLYFISPKVIFAASSMKYLVSRFYLVEHLTLMLVAIVFMTIYYVKLKNRIVEPKFAKRLFYVYLSTLVLILISIPWPFRIVGAGWF